MIMDEQLVFQVRKGLLSVIVLLLIMTSCTHEKPLPYKLELYRYMPDAPAKMKIFDLFEDGTDELFALRGVRSDQDSSEPSIPPSINIRRSATDKTIDQINVGQFGDFYIMGNSGTTGGRFGIIYERNFEVWIDEYEWRLEELKSDLSTQLKLADLKDKNGDGLWQGRLEFIDSFDMNGDKNEDLLFCISSTYDHEPRALVSVEGNSLQILWWLDWGIMSAKKYLLVEDIDGDGTKEIVAGNYANANHIEHNGISDVNSHIIVVNNDGSIRSVKIVGRQFTAVTPLAFVDQDQDGQRELIYKFSANDEMSESTSAISIMDLSTGAIEKKYSLRDRTESPAVVDLDNNGEMEVVIGYNDGEILVLDRDLKELHRSQIPDAKSIYISGYNDINSDGRSELFIMATFQNEPHLLMLSDKLEVLAKQPIENLPPGDYFQDLQVAKGHREESKTYYIAGRFSYHGLRIEPNSISAIYDLSWPLAAVLAILLVGLSILYAWNSNTKRKNELLLDTLLSSSGNKAVLLISNQFHFHGASEGAAKYIEEGVFSPKQFSDPEQKTGSSTIYSILAKLQDLPTSLLTEQVESTAQDGTSSVINVTARKVRDSRGKNHGFLVSLDENRSVDLNSLAHQSVEIGQELMHKIKTLTLVFNNDLYMLEKGLSEQKPESDTAEILQEMKSAAHAIGEIAKSYMELSSLDNLRFDKTNVNQLLVDTVMRLKDRSKQKIEFIFELDETLPEISVDRELMKSLIMNMVENSIKAVDDEGVIIIRSQLFRHLGQEDEAALKQYFAFSIIDNGSGIARELESRVFEPGFSGFSEGAGLGLTIAKRIVEMHEGTIQISSIQTGGTEVLVRLPYQNWS